MKDFKKGFMKAAGECVGSIASLFVVYKILEVLTNKQEPQKTEDPETEDLEPEVDDLEI